MKNVNLKLYLYWIFRWTRLFSDKFRYFQMLVELVLWEAGLLHFSACSRGQLKAHVLIYHHLLPSLAPSLVSNAVPTNSSVCCSMQYGIVPVSPTNWYDGRLSKKRFHLESLKHLIIRQALIHDTGTAVQEPLCAKLLKLEKLDIFRWIQHNLAPGGSWSYFHSTDTKAQSWCLIPESMLVNKENKRITRQYHTVSMLTRSWSHTFRCI